MKWKLFFFHAGDSKDKSDKEGATKRVLTRKAEKLTAKAASGISHLLPRKIKIEVWSNMEPHLTQTAEIIAEELGAQK